jgi:hypothetical protein
MCPHGSIGPSKRVLGNLTEGQMQRGVIERRDVNCRNNPTCDVTCRTLCLDAVQRAQTREIPYVSALEFIIKSRPHPARRKA